MKPTPTNDHETTEETGSLYAVTLRMVTPGFERAFRDHWALADALHRRALRIIKVEEQGEPPPLRPGALLTPVAQPTPPVIDAPDLLERIRDNESELDRLADATAALTAARDELTARLDALTAQHAALFARVMGMGETTHLKGLVNDMDLRLHALEAHALRLQGDF